MPKPIRSDNTHRSRGERHPKSKTPPMPLIRQVLDGSARPEARAELKALVAPAAVALYHRSCASQQ